MRNVQERIIHAPAAIVGSLLNDFGGPNDRLWPSPPWPAAQLDNGLEVGSRGGHDQIRYEVTEFEPGRRVRMTFDKSAGINGYHELFVTPEGPDRCRLTHIVEGRTHGPAIFLWPTVVRWMHEAVVHDLLDNAELAAAGRLAGAASTWSPWVKFLRRLRLKKPATVSV